MVVPYSLYNSPASILTWNVGSQEIWVLYPANAGIPKTTIVIKA
jgi:hypothetical protein